MQSINNSSGVQPDNNSCYFIPQQVISMLGRVFRPSSQPLQATAYISNNIGYSGFIGQDKKYEFAKHLKTPQGQAIQPAEKDFYVPLITQSFSPDTHWLILKIEWILKKIFFFLQPTKMTSTIAYPHMPSTLFYGAKENEKIRYFLDNQLVELTLKQGLHPLVEGQDLFENFLDTLSCWVKMNQKTGGQTLYLFEKDKPDHILTWKKYRCLTEDASIYNPRVGRQKVTKEILAELASYQDQSCPQFEILGEFFYTDSDSGTYKLKLFLGATRLEIENIQVLIDENFVVICGRRNPLNIPENTIIHHATPLEIRLEFTISPVKHGPVDKDSIILENLENGVIRFTVSGTLL